ncbi:MAG TPA: class I SAM-dependent methyltransferase [Candidatus Baltobacteraceae bacterium]|nr:class I SAM-dependent methyltransferase [Candidatus Baltobacteraceae bacterium]
MNDHDAMAAQAAIAARVGGFYETHPYPPPFDDIEPYRRAWGEARRRADAHLFWPREPFRDDRTILVAGCGTSQAAHYAVRWPRARVAGIDVSENSIAFERELRQKHSLENLELRRLEVERAGELGQTFDYIVCTGVLHHLADPAAGLKALSAVLAPGGAMHVMVYAPFGRAGIYLLQEYCRRLGIGWTGEEIDELAATLKALPRDHPLAPLLARSPDFATTAGLADALLHPNDRAYSVPQFMEFLHGAGLSFGRWVRQAPYLPQCGAPAQTPHRARLAALPVEEQHAAVELFRGTMVRHAAVVYAAGAPMRDYPAAFSGEVWANYVPIRLPGTTVVKERLPAGAAAVLINRNHADTDLYLPIDGERLRMFEAIDGERTAGEVSRLAGDRNAARDFFRQLWEWDEVVFDESRVPR